VMAKRHNYSFNSNSDKGFISPHNITTSNNLNKQTNTEVLRILPTSTMRSMENIEENIYDDIGT